MRPFAILTEPIDAVTLRAELACAQAGAVVVFEGVVRDHHAAKSVSRLDYDCYAPLAAREGQRILDQATLRWSLPRALAAHRVGSLEVGELAVWVGVAAQHRAEAFAASEWIIAEIKRRLPIWKHEVETGGAASWVSGTPASGAEV